MRLNRKAQLEALCTALSLGTFEYQRNAALQNDYSNEDGVLFATSRMVFLEHLNAYFTAQLKKEQSDDNSFATVLEDIASIAGARVRNALQYSAIEPSPGVSTDARTPNREGTSKTLFERLKLLFPRA